MIAFCNTNAGRLCANTIAGLISADGAEKVRDHIIVLTENIYQSLPSGDYGRGDVRRMIDRLTREGK